MLETMGELRILGSLLTYVLLRIIMRKELMTRKELDRKLLRAGWKIEHGKSHDLAVSQTGRLVALPRHKGDLKAGTVKQILKITGLE
jgi:predicted RNA binding protein YcfA (HicA-like mRNA interferase family)